MDAAISQVVLQTQASDSKETDLVVDIDGLARKKRRSHSPSRSSTTVFCSTVNQRESMEFNYSTLVNPSTVVATGCFTTLPVRFHRDEKLAIRGSKQMEVDWQLAFGKPPFSPGCQNPRGHLAATSLPESLPDRIAISAYIMDYMLHHDGMYQRRCSLSGGPC